MGSRTTYFTRKGSERTGPQGIRQDDAVSHKMEGVRRAALRPMESNGKRHHTESQREQRRITLNSKRQGCDRLRKGTSFWVIRGGRREATVILAEGLLIYWGYSRGVGIG